jgi:peptide/nickel transport system ATP-binding protein
VLREIVPGHTVACHWAEQIHSGQIAPRASAVVEAVIDAEPPATVPIAGDSTITTLGPPPGI